MIIHASYHDLTPDAEVEGTFDGVYANAVQSVAFFWV